MNVLKLDENVKDESYKLKPLNVESFSIEFNDVNKTITLFVNHRKTAVLFDKTINKYDEILSLVNKTINSWRMQ